jgi:hypothetical protein
MAQNSGAGLGVANPREQRHKTAMPEKIKVLLSQENVELLATLFQKIDKDRSKSLDIQEICAFFRHITLNRVEIKPEMFASHFTNEGKQITDRLTFSESIPFLITAGWICGKIMDKLGDE